MLSFEKKRDATFPNYRMGINSNQGKFEIQGKNKTLMAVDSNAVHFEKVDIKVQKDLKFNLKSEFAVNGHA